MMNQSELPKDRHAKARCKYGYGYEAASNNVKKHEQRNHYICRLCADGRGLGPQESKAHQHHRLSLEFFSMDLTRNHHPGRSMQVHSSLCKEFNINPDISTMFRRMMTSGLTPIEPDTAIPSEIHAAFGSDHEMPHIIANGKDSAIHISYEQLWTSILSEIIQNKGVSRDGFLA